MFYRLAVMTLMGVLFCRRGCIPLYKARHCSLIFIKSCVSLRHKSQNLGVGLEVGLKRYPCVSYDDTILV